MLNIDYAFSAIALKQHGIVSNRELKQMGYSCNQISYLVKQKHIRKIAKGIYQSDLVSTTKKSEIYSITAQRPGRAAAANETALYIHGQIKKIIDIEICIPRNSNFKSKGVCATRISNFHDLAIDTIDSIPTVCIEHALLSTYSRFTHNRAKEYLSNAIINKLTTCEKLNSQLQEMPFVKSKNEIRKCIINLHEELEGIESVFELRIAKIINQFGIGKPVRQYELQLDLRIVRLDFAYPHLKLYIEADGFKYHSASGNFINDRRRQNLLSIYGWQVIRVTPRMSDREIAQYIINALIRYG
jgi:hypothetical protein